MSSLLRKLRRQKSFNARTRTTAKCPGCDSQLTFAAVDEGGDVLLHPIPYCQYFLETDADDILRKILSIN